MLVTYCWMTYFRTFYNCYCAFRDAARLFSVYLETLINVKLHIWPYLLALRKIYTGQTQLSLGSSAKQTALRQQRFECEHFSVISVVMFKKFNSVFNQSQTTLLMFKKSVIKIKIIKISLCWTVYSFFLRLRFSRNSQLSRHITFKIHPLCFQHKNWHEIFFKQHNL